MPKRTKDRKTDTPLAQGIADRGGLANQNYKVSKKLPRLVSLILYSWAALLLAISSWYPETLQSSIIAVFSLVLLCVTVRRAAPSYLGFFCYGFVLSVFSYYWVPDTITLFGGFPLIVSRGLFSLFSILSAFQFLFLAWMLKAGEKFFGQQRVFLLPVAWFVAEQLVPRVFPWKLSYMQIYWSPFSALAEIAGAGVLSLLLLFWISSLVSFKELLGREKLAFLCSLLLLWFGFSLDSRVAQEIEKASLVKVGVIQGNLDPFQKGDLNELNENLKIYRGLSESAVRAGADFLVWPESVVNSWAPVDIESVAGTRFDPYPEHSAPLLYGGLSFEKRSQEEHRLVSEGVSSATIKKRLRYKSYNSAFLLDQSGRVGGIYHKRVLMPFGEYLPFRDIWPEVRELSPMSGDFMPGSAAAAFNVDLPGKDFKVAPLICYEDMVPSVAREAVRKGAQLLVNMSNDAWYGESVAPRQHHLLAMWRAIELRRALVRVTNTGFTAVVSPRGQTTRTLKDFTEDFMVEEAPLLDRQTLFAKLGEVPQLSLAFFGLVLVIYWRIAPVDNGQRKMLSGQKTGH